MIENDTSAIVIKQPETNELAQTSLGVIDAANAIVVNDPTTMRAAGEHLRQIKTVRQRISAEFTQPIKDAHSAHKSILALKKKLDGPLEQAEGAVKRKVCAYTDEQDRIRREEQRRLENEARKKEEERRLAEAERLEEVRKAAVAEGNNEEAEEIDEAIDEVLEAPVVVTLSAVRSVVPRVDGVQTKKIWKFRVVNRNLIPLQYMMPDKLALGAHARSMTDKASVPGVEFYPESSVAVSAY